MPRRLGGRLVLALLLLALLYPSCISAERFIIRSPPTNHGPSLLECGTDSPSPLGLGELPPTTSSVLLCAEINAGTGGYGSVTVSLGPPAAGVITVAAVRTPNRPR